MPTLTLQVGIVLEKRKARSQWLDVLWEACDVLPDAPAAEPGTSLGKIGDGERFYAGSAQLEAHTYETPQYRDNLSSGKPTIWVVLRPQPGEDLPQIVKVTCDPTEGEGYSETGWDTVSVVPMPEVIEAALAHFVEEHHVDRAYFKRKRDRADPDALAKFSKGPDRDREQRAIDQKDRDA
jgi:hypothetical protein